MGNEGSMEAGDGGLDGNLVGAEADEERKKLHGTMADAMPRRVLRSRSAVLSM